MRFVSGIAARMRGIRKEIRHSRRLRDWPGLTLLGLARYADTTKPDPLSRACCRLFPVLKVRTDRLDHVAAFMNPADPSHLVIFDEVVAENVYDLSLVPFVPDRIIDCGGHIGFFTARAAGRFPGVPIITFEPMPKNADLLEAMVRGNKLNGEVRRAAVSDRDGSVQFYERISFGGSMTSEVGGVVASHDVPLVNLIKLVDEIAAPSLLIKLDIEGEEENLLPKLIPHLPRQTAVFFETHTSDRGWDLIAAALIAAGFDVRLLRTREPFRDGFALRQHG
jgi:FkbM family methyltransferase